jgi:hypothetical protein
MRTQIDYVFTMKENTIQNRLKLYKMFFGVFSTFDDFSAVLERCTQNYECLCLDNTVQTTSPQDCVFWYKARVDHARFRLCSPSFYRMDEQSRRAVGSEPESEAADPGRPGKARLLVTKEEEEEEPPDEEER